MPTTLAGKVALITGAGGTIGSAVVHELAQRGATIALAYYQRQERVQALKEKLDQAQVRSGIYQFDVRCLEEVRQAHERIADELGKVSILVNNAGIIRDRSFRKMTDEEWQEVISADLTGVFNCTNVFVSDMLGGGGGRIINISSVIGQTGAYGQTNYAAAKAGVIGFTKALAIELAQYGITVNAVCPGYVDSDMLRSVPPQIRESLLQKIPLRRFAQPAEVARVVRFLAEEADYVTGQCINVNGGLYS